MLQASKAEALFAVDAYNRAGERRSLEAFVVHMHLAWLYLLHAMMTDAGVDYRDRQKDGRRFVKVDGEPKTWELARCMRWKWPSNRDPVRKNIEFFIGLRNKIEHRYQDAVALAVAGHAQAHILNYEDAVVDAFGVGEGLSDRLRFPVFLSSLTPQGMEVTKRLRARMPARTVRYLDEFHDDLEPETAEDQRFEFRIHLIPQVGPRSSADMAIKFIHWDDLDAKQQKALAAVGKAGVVAVRVKEKPVRNLDLYRPKEVVRLVREKRPDFNMGTFIARWKADGVRPPGGSADPSETDARYCVYDRAYEGHLYTDAYIKKLIKDSE